MRASQPVKDIRVEPCAPPIPTTIRYEAWVPGEEERYGTAYGATREEAIQNLTDDIENRDDEWVEVRVVEDGK